MSKPILITRIDNKANPGTYLSYILSASKWSDVTYSFESEYPMSLYDLEVEPADICSEAQREAWDSMKPSGSATSNSIKAYGDVPTIDIPIILKVVKK